MKAISEVTCLVIDSGLFLPFARRMAEDCKRVIFYNPDRRAFPSMKQGRIGAGFEDIETTLDFWPLLPDIDLVCFPDIGHAGLQHHLETVGKPVWGSRMGDSIEINRGYFLKLIESLGLDIPEYKVITGWSHLVNHLIDKEDQYIKISRWRGDMETTHWRNWSMDSGWLDWLAVNLGPLKEHMNFLVFPAIDTPLEIGADTYCIDGRWPNHMINGIEAKDSCYFGSVMERGDMPDQIQNIVEAITPFMSGVRYRNQISFEVRVKDDKSYWIDATQRAGMPSSASQQLLCTNFPEVVLAGANGDLVQPEFDHKFSIECMVSSKTKDSWDVVDLPKQIERSVRFGNCAFVDGCYAFPPDDFHSGELGWLCATGNTPSETLEAAKELCDQLPDGLDASVEKMVDLIKEAEQAHSSGIPISDEPMPQIQEVIQ